MHIKHPQYYYSDHHECKYRDIYRFWRRYLKLLYPEILRKISVELNTAKTIKVKANMMIELKKIKEKHK